MRKGEDIMKKKIAIILGVVLVIITGGLYMFVGDYYRPQEEALVAAQQGVTMNGNLVFTGDNELGFIIYPGGKVDEKAYANLAKELNDEGHTVVIAKMPFRFSILRSNKANSIIETHDGIEEWVIIGHSLGGTSASMFADKHPDKLSGIVFLGSYPYRDLSSTDMKGIGILGDKDEVLNIENAENSESFYPEDYEIFILDGANHAQFGNYGEQKGDGEATMSWEQQHNRVVSIILEHFTN